MGGQRVHLSPWILIKIIQILNRSPSRRVRITSIPPCLARSSIYNEPLGKKRNSRMAS